MSKTTIIPAVERVRRVCECGHRAQHHVRKFTGKLYCTRPGCPCGDFTEVKPA